MKTDSQMPTILASVFTAFVFAVGIVGFGGDIANYLVTSAEQVHEKQSESQLNIKSVTQKASASSHCPGYSSSLGGGSSSPCYRSGSTTYTVVLSGGAVPGPDAKDDNYTTTKNTDLVVASTSNGLLANDTGSNLEVDLATIGPASNGSWSSLNKDGTFTYDPDPSYTGTWSFTYQADGDNGSDYATGTINVTSSGGNTCPFPPGAINGEAYTVTSGQSITRDVSNNDSDPDGDNLTYSLESGPSDGTLNLNSDGTFTYDHDGGSTSTDSFTYEVDDGNGCTDQATTNINIDDKKPVAQIDGPDSVEYCESLATEVLYDGGSSYDTDGTDIITDYNWSVAPNPPASITDLTGQTTNLSVPVDWTNTTDLTLQVKDDEGSTNSTTTSIDILVPDYKIDLTQPDDNRLWITASSTKRSTKGIIEVSDFSDPNFSYDFEDLELKLTDTGGIPVDAFSTSSDPTENTYSIWINPQNESQQLAFGTYDITVSVQLKLANSPLCVYADPEVDLKVRAQTTAEF